MWRKEERQQSFAEQEVYASMGSNQRLEEITGLLDWEAIERQLGEVYAAGEGRPAYRPLQMFKALVLQQWYQLSDPQGWKRHCLTASAFAALSDWDSNSGFPTTAR